MEKNKPEQDNIMGTLPVKKLMFVMSWPMVLSMFIQSCYAIVDSIFVAKLSQDAFVALSLIFPIQMLMIAFNVGIGVGINAMLARRLGEKNYEEANDVATHAYVLYFILGVFYAVFGIFFARGFMELFSENPAVVDYGTTYLRIILLFGFGVCFQFAGERMMQATGNPIWNMYVQASGAVINVILDPILIFGLFGAPAMGIAGAAVATVTGQWIGALIGVYLLRFHVRQIHVSLRGFRLKKDVVGPILRISMPAIVVQSLATVMSLGMNKIFTLHSETYVAVLGAYFKIQNFVYLVVFSLSNVIIPVVAFNCGAREIARVRQTIRMSIVIGLVSVLGGSLLLLLIPGPILAAFSLEGEALTMGIPAMRIVSLSFLAGSVSLIFGYTFQAIGCNSQSLLISLLRQVIVLLPLAAILIKVEPLLTWAAFPITEFGCLVFATFLFRRAYHKRIAVLENDG